MGPFSEAEATKFGFNRMEEIFLQEEKRHARRRNRILREKAS
jgi:hypothetical protein